MAQATAASPTPLLETRGLTKAFAGVEVLRDVDFAIRPGEIHALLGENGAGKSTFVKMLAGVLRPTCGEIRLGGIPVSFATPADAQRLGIALIHQEPISFPDLSVAENLAIGRGGGLLGRVRWQAIEDEARRLMDLLGADIEVTRPMRGLSVADQQVVEIARALADDGRLIIMDEPTAALTPQEADTLFRTVRRLRDEGRTFLFISHRLEEVRALCDRATVFRDGAWVATRDMATLADAEIIQLMIGRPLSDYFHRGEHQAGPVALEVKGFSAAGHFEDVSVAVRRGEIVGLAGLVGAGRTAVANAIFGLLNRTAGTLRIDGAEATIRSPSDAIAHGIGFVPEDRAAAGIFASLPLSSNITVSALRRVAPKLAIDRTAERALAAESIADLDIRCTDMRQPVGELSGGNQQKAILARWLLTGPRILIVDEPTRGIDIGVRTEFYDRIGALAANGCAILLISSDLPELLALSDRILVMCEGRVTAEVARAEATQEKVMDAAVPRSGRHGDAGGLAL